MWRTAVILIALTASAAAGELRPLGDNSVCLDGGTEVRPGINRIQLAPCDHGDGQNIRRGEHRTIYVGGLCLQAVSVKGSEKIEITAMRCHGRDGQIWIFTRDGRLTSGQKLCLTLTGAATARELLMTPCKEMPDDMTDQKWTIHGKFD